VDSSRPWSDAPPPDTVRPRTLGVLNVIFGAIFVLAGCLGLGGTLYMIVVAGTAGGMQEIMAAERQLQLESLDRQLADERDEAKRAALHRRRDSLEAQPAMPFGGQDMGDMMAPYTDPRVVGWTVAVTGGGMLLDGLLFLSGLGLLKLRSWGRSLALFTAGSKVLLVVAGNAAFLLMVLPFWHSEWQKMDAAVAAAGIATSIDVSVYSLVVYVADTAIKLATGLIYPFVLLVMLRRPAVKAAFAPPA